MSDETHTVVVRCSYCEELTEVPFKFGAVMPRASADEGVTVYVPLLVGGPHRCDSKRAVSERSSWLRVRR